MKKPIILQRPMQVKDLTVEELKFLIQETVTETLQAMLTDPDEGKQLKPEVRQQLLKSLEKTQAGERGVAAEEVAKRLGLAW
jgi:hypothetical protein